MSILAGKIYHFVLLHPVLLKVILVLGLLYILGSIVSVMLDAYLDVKKMPREEMFHCNKHGQFAKKHCIQLFPELGGRPVNSWVCPMCYREKVFTEPNRKLKLN